MKAKPRSSRNKRVPPGRATDGFSSAWRMGFRRILILRFLMLREGFASNRRDTVLPLLISAGLASVPALLNIGLLMGKSTWATPTFKDFLWTWAFATVNFIVIMASVGSWVFVARRSDEIDRLISDPLEQHRVGMWLVRHYSLGRQIPLPAFGLLSSICYLGIFHGAVQSTVDVTVVSFISVAWTSLLAGNALHWLFVAPSIVGRIRKVKGLALRWFDPASTPGLLALSRGTGFSAVTLVAGAAGVALIGFVAPNTAQIGPVQVLLIAFFAVLMSAIVLSGLRPLLQIRWLIATSKELSLAELSNRMPSLVDMTQEKLAPDRTLDAYRAVSQAPNWPFSTSALVQFSAALLATVVAFVLSLI